MCINLFHGCFSFLFFSQSVCSGGSLEDYFANLTDQALVILDSFHSLPLTQPPLKKLLLNTKCKLHIIMTTSISSTPERIEEQCHNSLNRGFQLHKLKPLHCLSASQRLIYNVVSQFDLKPMNKEQRIFVFMEEVACGQPSLLNITNALLVDCIKESPNPSDGLMKFYEQVIDNTFTEINSAIDREEKASQEAKQKSLDEARALAVKLGLVALPSQKPSELTESHIADNVHKKAIIYAHQLIGFAKLDHLEHLLLSCLCSLYCIPVHGFVIKALYTMLHSINQDLESEPAPVDNPEWLFTETNLYKFSFIVQYPHPVAQAPSADKNGGRETSDSYYVVPPVVCEAIQLSLSESDKVILSSLLYQLLNELRAQLEPEEEKETIETTEEVQLEMNKHVPSTLSATANSSMLLHCVALHGFLLQTVSNDFELYGKDVIMTVSKEYIRNKVKARGNEGLAELVMDMLL